MNWLTLELLLFGLLILLSGLFSATEVAFTGLSVTQQKRIKRMRPKSLKLWDQSPDRVLATLLLSNNAIHAAVGVLVATFSHRLAQIIPWKPSLITLVVGFFSALMVLSFGEIFPKVWARHRTIPWALRISSLMAAWSHVIKPFAAASLVITNFILRGYRKRHRGLLFLKETELKRIFTNSAIPHSSRKILDNVLDFSKSTVKDVMIPRNDIFAVSNKEPMETMIEKVISSGLSRVPVYSTSLDKMIGLLYSKDLLVAWRNNALVVLADLLRPLHFVTPDLPLTDLMRVFKSGRHHLAIVCDRTPTQNILGLVTIQDALEAIVGELKDES